MKDSPAICFYLAGLVILCATIVAHCQTRVFNLVVDGKSICTAWAAEGRGGERVMVSAGHCAEVIKVNSTVSAFDAETGDRFPLALLEHRHEWTATIDYSIFRYTTPQVPKTAFKTSVVMPQVGASVITIAGPIGLMPIYVQGYYVGRIRLVDNPHEEINGMYGIQLPAAPGASGSPVLDTQGNVWGILVGGFNRLPGIALVVPVPINRYGLGLE